MPQQDARAVDLPSRASARAIQYSGSPLAQSEAVTMQMPQGITVTSIQQRVQDGADEGHAARRIRRQAGRARAARASRQSAKAARSSCTRVPAGIGRRAAGWPRQAVALAGQHQVRLAAGGRAGLQVAQAVADRRHVRFRSTPKRSPICSNRPGSGLRQLAAFVGAVRAIEHRVDAAAHARPAACASWRAWR